MRLNRTVGRVPLLAALVLTAAACAQAGTQVVVIKQMHFDPPQVTVQPGDTVEWKNEDIFTHTATADDNSFDSGEIAPGKSWQMTFSKAANVGYYCMLHPNMKASIVVATGAPTQRTNAAANAPQSLRLRPPTSPEEFHPILVNFTAALLPLALLSDVLGLFFKRQSLHNAAWWMVLYEAILTPFTAAAGWWWKHAAGAHLPQRLITVHQWLGTTAAVLFIVLALWRWSIHKRRVAPSIGYLAFAAVAVLALIYQGSLGGAMVFGK